MKKLMIVALVLASSASAAQARTSYWNLCWSSFPGLGKTGLWLHQCMAVNHSNNF